MNDKTRKGIIFVVFASTLVWGYFNLIKKPLAMTTTTPDLATVTPLAPAAISAMPDSLTLAELRNTDWGDDPFKKGISPAFETSSVERAASPQWNLSGIVYSPTDPLAIINGKMVRVGDAVDNAKVTKIEKKNVTLDYGGSSITLTVNKG
ncbi:MAG: hypothetical protein AAB305_01865 [Candidatus Zixiibacteriota bacterium]